MKPQSYGFCVIRRPLLSRNILEDFHARIVVAPLNLSLNYEVSFLIRCFWKGCSWPPDHFTI